MKFNTSSTALRTFVRGAAVLAALAGTVAVAQPSQIDVNGSPSAAGVTRTKLVAVEDLNLQSKRDKRRLAVRLTLASREVCNEQNVVGAAGRWDYRRCYGEALDGARAQAVQRLASGGTAAIQVASR